MITRIGILAGLVLADVATTTAALNIGAREMNTVMTWAVQDPVIHLVVKISLVLILVYLIERQGPRLLTFLKNRKDTWDPAAWYPTFQARSYCAIWALYGGALVNNIIWISILSGGP